MKKIKLLKIFLLFCLIFSVSICNAQDIKDIAYRKARRIYYQVKKTVKEYIKILKNFTEKKEEKSKKTNIYEMGEFYFKVKKKILKNSENNPDKLPYFVEVQFRKNGYSINNEIKLKLEYIDGEFHSEKIKIKQGEYSLTKFLIKNSKNEIVYLVPSTKINNNASKNISISLPYDFEVEENKLVPINLEIIECQKDKPSSLYGYIDFREEIINKINLKIDVYIDEVLTDAKIYVSYSNDEKAKEDLYQVSKKSNYLTVNYEQKGELKLRIEKETYEPQILVYPLYSLKKIAEKPIKVYLKKKGSTTTPYKQGEELWYKFDKVNEEEIMAFHNADWYISEDVSIDIAKERRDNWWNNLSEQWKTIFFGSKEKPKDKEIIELFKKETLIYKKCRLENVSGLKCLTNLKKLDLSNNNIISIDDLKYLINLKELSLKKNKIDNILELKELRNLTFLDIRSNKISDIKVLENLNKLETLYIKDNPISKASIDKAKNYLAKGCFLYTGKGLHIVN